MPRFQVLIQNKPKTRPRWQADSASTTDELEKRLVEQRTALLSFVSGDRTRSKLKFDRRDKAQFFSVLSDAVHMEMPVVKVLDRLSRALAQPTSKAVCKRLRDKTLDGESLVSAMREMPGAFSESEIGILDAFGRIGNLSDGLRRCYELLDRADRVIRTIKKALIYPVIVAVLAVVFIVYIGKGPLPMLRAQYTTVAPPAMFKMVCMVVDLTLNNYPAMIALAAVGIPTLIFLYRRAIRSPLCHKILLRLPKIGSFIKTYINANFLRTYTALTVSEVPEPEKMKMCRGLSGLQPYQEAFAWAQINTLAGATPHGVLADYEPLFGESTVGMFEMGSEGNMAAVLTNYLKPVERDLDDAVDSFKEMATPLALMVILPPLLLMVVGLFTGIVGLMNVY